MMPIGNKSLTLRQIRRGMTAIELIKSNRTVLELMCSNGIAPSDVKYVPLVEEYRRMVHEGYKKTYIKAVLADRFGIKLRAVEYILTRMRKVVKFA